MQEAAQTWEQAAMQRVHHINTTSLQLVPGNDAYKKMPTGVFFFTLFIYEVAWSAVQNNVGKAR